MYIYIYIYISLWGAWKQACINGHQFRLEENSDYIGVVYQFGVKGMRARKHVPYQFRVEGSEGTSAIVCMSYLINNNSFFTEYVRSPAPIR